MYEFELSADAVNPQFLELQDVFFIHIIAVIGVYLQMGGPFDYSCVVNGIPAVQTGATATRLDPFKAYFFSHPGNCRQLLRRGHGMAGLPPFC